MFVSPHISSIRERIQINGEKIPQEDFCRLYDDILKFEKAWEIQLGVFQFILAMALVYFKEQECQYVILECGIGGWSSQTNIADANYAVITSIGMDHCETLGKTLEAICRDKAGILRNKVPCFVGPTVPLDILGPICKNYKSKLIVVQPEDESFLTCNKELALSVYRKILQDDKEMDKGLPEEEIERCLNVSPPCRMELIPEENYKNIFPELEYYPKAVYMDVGHNPPGLKSLMHSIKRVHGKKSRIYVVISFSSKKNVTSSLMILINQAVHVRFIVVGHFRLINAEQTNEEIKTIKMSALTNSLRVSDLKHNGDLAENMKDIFELINKKKETNAIIVCCGSVFIMEGVRNYFSIPQIRDCEVLSTNI
jgi:dihydrofolate synthase / folylpolyglutamate synthase